MGALGTSSPSLEEEKATQRETLGMGINAVVLDAASSLGLIIFLSRSSANFLLMLCTILFAREFEIRLYKGT